MRGHDLKLLHGAHTPIFLGLFIAPSNPLLETIPIQ